jgi:hypothetical protein
MADNDEFRKPFAPYVEWAAATHFEYLPGDWFSVLLELNQPVAEFARQIEASDLLRDLIKIPSMYQATPRDFAPEDLKFCMGIMRREVLEAVVGRSNREEIRKIIASTLKAIERIELGTPAPKSFQPGRSAPVAASLSTSPPRHVIVAVIDDGLAFAHERFRFASGKTRFKYFWDQNDLPSNVLLPGNKARQDFGFGRELTGNDIDNLISQCNHAGSVDEDEVYRRAHQRLVARRAAHGTHVMDVACGLDPHVASASSPYLIGVQLPRWVTEETSGGLLTPLVDAAITYILSRADLIAAEDGTAPLPVVINLSYGTIAGPHDGTGALEAAIDQRIASRKLAPLSVVLPAGNHYLARCHAQIGLPDGGGIKHKPRAHLDWRVQPDNKACSFAEVWLPLTAHTGTRPHLALRIQTPTGHRSPWLHPGQYWAWPSAADVRFEAAYYNAPGQRSWLRLAMSPTAAMSAAGHTAPSGNWEIEIENHGGAVQFDAWVQRGDTPFGYPLWGRQSRFDDPEYVRFDVAGRAEEQDSNASHVRRRGTLNALATGRYSTVVGSYRRSDGKPSEFSGSGPASSRTGPDASAVADDSVAARGVIAAGTRSGSVLALRGTSVAAPQVTRRIADWMAQGLVADRTMVRQYAANGDPGAPKPGTKEEERLGAGRFDGPEPSPQEPPPRDLRWKRW